MTSKAKDSEFETYIIPPNFIEGSTLFGGLFKLRNVIEAGILAALVGVPVFLLNLVGLSNMLDNEVARRKPVKRSHGEVVGAAVVDGKLLGKVVQ